MTAPHVSEPPDAPRDPSEVEFYVRPIDPKPFTGPRHGPYILIPYRTPLAPRIPLWAWALSGVLLAIAACWAVWRWE